MKRYYFDATGDRHEDEYGAYVLLSDIPQWQPIETAPKDGTVVYAYHPTGSFGGTTPACRAVFWHDGIWITDACYSSNEGSTGYTLWHPLPEPPK